MLLNYRPLFSPDGNRARVKASKSSRPRIRTLKGDLASRLVRRFRKDPYIGRSKERELVCGGSEL